MTESQRQELLNIQYNIIHTNKEKLIGTDYIGIKIAMGVAQLKDYADIIEQTKEWRKDINNAEAEIKRLEAINVKEEYSDIQIQ